MSRRECKHWLIGKQRRGGRQGRRQVPAAKGAQADTAMLKYATSSGPQRSGIALVLLYFIDLYVESLSMAIAFASMDVHLHMPTCQVQPFGQSPLRIPSLATANNFHCLKCRATAAKQPQDLKLATDIPLALEHVAVGAARIPLVIADCDAVMQMYIDAGQGDRDPYWTCPWPSSIALAQELLERPSLVQGLRVADLGCGLGLGGLAAALAGAAEVVFLDREPLALQCALVNCQLSGFHIPEGSLLQAEVEALASTEGDVAAALAKARKQRRDGNTLPCRVHAEVYDWSNPVSLAAFDVVVACDVLYETFSVEVSTHNSQ